MTLTRLSIQPCFLPGPILVLIHTSVICRKIDCWCLHWFYCVIGFLYSQLYNLSMYSSIMLSVWHRMKLWISIGRTQNKTQKVHFIISYMNMHVAVCRPPYVNPTLQNIHPFPWSLQTLLNFPKKHLSMPTYSIDCTIEDLILSWGSTDHWGEGVWRILTLVYRLKVGLYRLSWLNLHGCTSL